ncbi:MAG TPA: hypothetical protein RMH26_11775, partial [Polyangiaceae bacterium LLY-WYZ-15_(1-7)]|nr:hypothetical protein [Polyangiaceae bacterium LLY-WYZ-15_(1-7)]
MARSLLPRLAPSLLLLALAACGDDDAPADAGPDGGAVDAGTDAGPVDAGPPPDPIAFPEEGPIAGAAG